MRKCVFFDRDGIVNVSPGAERYVMSWDRFHLVPEFAECAAVAGEKGYDVIIITNQSVVAKGLLSADGLNEIHNNMKKLLADFYGIILLDIIHCPHNPGECDCRKPLPGMFFKAAEKHSIALSGSWMIGDSETDVQAGNKAGCRTILVGKRPVNCAPDIVSNSMKDLVEVLRNNL